MDRLAVKNNEGEKEEDIKMPILNSNFIPPSERALIDPRNKAQSDFFRDIREEDIHFDTRLTPPEEEEKEPPKKRRRLPTPKLDEYGNVVK